MSTTHSNLHKSSADRLISSVRNSTDSPFFKLPPELRNRIYRLVLGDRPIHVRARTLRTHSKSKLSFCKAADTGLAPAVKTNEQSSAVHVYRSKLHRYGPPSSSYDQLHRACLRTSHAAAAPISQILDLVLVSRQIHREAALIVFASNRFRFHGVGSLEWFAESLAPCQLRALMSITVSIQSGKKAAMTRSVLKSFSGVRSLSVAFETGPIWHAPSAGLEYLTQEVNRHWKQRRMASFAALKKVDKVEVVPVLRLWGRTPLQGFIAEGLGSWAKEKERELLEGR